MQLTSNSSKMCVYVCVLGEGERMINQTLQNVKKKKINVFGGKLVYLGKKYKGDHLFLLKIDSLQRNEMDKQKRHEV